MVWRKSGQDPRCCIPVLPFMGDMTLLDPGLCEGGGHGLVSLYPRAVPSALHREDAHQKPNIQMHG